MAPKEQPADVQDFAQPVSEAPLYTRKQVASRPDLLIVHDEVYSAARFQSQHPGGAVFVSMFGGRDATEAFMEYHSREFPRQRMAEFLEGRLHPDDKPTPYDKDYLKLAREVLKDLPNRGFAPAAYWVKLAVIMSAAVATEAYLFFVERSLAGSLFLGWLFALIGLNIQHDANHGTLSRHGNVNWFFGLAQDYIGGSSILWLQEHVVLHHLFTNDTEKDPDIALGAPAIKLNPTHPVLPWYALQHLYVFPGQAMFGIKILFLDFIELLRYQWVGVKISPLANYMYLPSILMKLGFYFRFVVLPLYQNPSLHTAMCVLTTVMMGAGYLAFFFTLSHNFAGVAHVGPGGGTPRDASFMKRQVETSSNVGGRLLAVVNGGLNYQIEHHLFPRIHHAHYANIAPKVRVFCEKKGLKYVHYPTITENLFAMMAYLRQQGTDKGKFSVSRTIATLRKVLLEDHH